MRADPFNQMYAYNTIGNLTSMTGVGSYTCDPAHKHQATAAGSHSFSYDVAGNMTSRTIAGQATQGLVWDESSRLESITEGASTTGFLYDADGSRVTRCDGGVTTVMIDSTFEWSSAESPSGTRPLAAGATSPFGGGNRSREVLLAWRSGDRDAGR